MKTLNDSGESPQERLRRVLMELNLTTMARELSELLSRAEREGPSYSDFLFDALSIEQGARTERRIQRRERWSRLGPYVTLEGFDFSARPQLSPQVLKELMSCRFVEERRNLIIVGKPSTGKTTVGQAIGHAACRRGMSVYFVSMHEMLESLHASRADGTYRKVFRRVTQPNLLVVDDVGFSTLGKVEANELFRVVSMRYLARSTMIITNLPFRKWGDFLPSPAHAVAIADRLIHDATILRFTGKPFRNPRDIHGPPLDDE